MSPLNSAVLGLAEKHPVDTSPPESLEGQKGVLSCILLEANQEGGGEAGMLGQISAADFHDLRCRKIHAAIVRLQHDDRTKYGHLFFPA